MNDTRSATTLQICGRSGDVPSGNEKLKALAPSIGNRPNYSSRNVSRYNPTYHPVYYVGSSYAHHQYHQYHPSAPHHYDPTYPVYYNPNDVPKCNDTRIPHAATHGNCRHRNWNPTDPPSPLNSSTSTTAKNNSALKARANSPEKSQLAPNIMTASCPRFPSKTLSTGEYIDPKILEAAKALELPVGGNKYSVAHWKQALRLCYRWKTTTNKQERQFYRTSTTTSSLSSTTLKSIKFFCENILKRKSKRRQFAIHWKESGLKKIVDDRSSSSTDGAPFAYDDPKLETLIDDYFSGRTRSTGYNQAKEKLLDKRQMEIIELWDELMSGTTILREASSHQKLYLIQQAIERPYRNEKVQIEAKDQKSIHNVAIEGYGGQSYWGGNNNASLNDFDETAVLHDLSSKTFGGNLPANEEMNKRFWKCVDSCSNIPKRMVKKSRIEGCDESKTPQRFSRNACCTSSDGSISRNTKSPRVGEDKENKTLSSVVQVRNWIDPSEEGQPDIMYFPYHRSSRSRRNFVVGICLLVL